MEGFGSMFERLNNTVDFYRGSKNQQLNQNSNLLNMYWNTLMNYLRTFQIDRATPFHFPFDCFYLEAGKLYSTIPFYYHGHLTRKRSLNFALPDYLISCGLPGDQSLLMENLTNILVELLEQYQFSRSESALQRLQRFSPELSAFLRSVPMSMVAGCLVYRSAQPYNVYQQLYSHIPAIGLVVPPNIPRQILREFFSAKMNELPKSTPVFPDPSLVFYHSHDFWNLTYQPNAAKCIAEPMIPAPACSVKAIPWQQPPAAPPSQVEALLATFVGYDLTALKTLAVLFSRILAPSFGSTVLYTHSNADTLRSFFAKVFAPWLISLPSQSGSSPKERISINRLAKSGSLRTLFEAQAAGKGLVLLLDTPASDSNKQSLSRLRKGTPIPIHHPFVPKQYLKSNAHLLCITDDRNRAQKLRKQLKANWIDLSSVEYPVTEAPVLSDETLCWLRCVLPLLGLQLLSADASAYTSPASEPIPFDAVEDFMTEGAIKGPGAFCTSFDLYNAYQSYYRARFSADPPLSKIVFTKRARAYAASQGPHMNYRHTRLGKDKRLRWYFTGLAPDPWAEVIPPAPPEDQKTAFSEYLNSGFFLMPQIPFHRQFPKTTVVKKSLISP